MKTTTKILFNKNKYEEDVAYKVSAYFIHRLCFKIELIAWNIIELKLSTIRKVGFASFYYIIF